MNKTQDIATMELMLRQGRVPALLSAVLLLVALLLLGLSPGAPGWVFGLLLAGSVLAGLVQIYHAARVALDAGLLRLLRKEGLHGEAAALRVDEILHAAGLRHRQAGEPLRDWESRWAGMRCLLRWQYAAALLQLALLLLALFWPQP